MITTSVSELPTKVIIEWAQSGKAPPEWRIFPSGAVTRRYRYFAWTAVILICYPFIVGAALWGIAARLFVTGDGFTVLLANAAIIVLVFAVGGVILWSFYRLLKPLQQRISDNRE